MESVTERRFRFPDQVQENVVLNRVSGFKNAGLVALANAVQPFTFYGDYLRVLDKNFLNPISPNSPTQYFFLIEDTLFSKKDTIWVISFRPRKGKIFDALAGTLHLHSDGWAIQNVIAHPADPNSNIDLRIEQAYDRLKTNTQADTAKTVWFPSQLNFELEFRRYPAPHAGIRAAGRSYITDVNLNPAAWRRYFDPEMPLILAPKANTRADSAWPRWRTMAPLTHKEYRTYAYMDSLGAREKLDSWSNVMDYLATGRVPLKAGICLDLNRLLVVNDFEGTRLGVGFSNAQSKPLLLPKRLESGFYVGYGLRDRAAKYGGYALWRMVRGWQTQLRLGWQRDLREPGAPYELRAASVLNRSLYADRMDYTDELSASLSSQLWRGALASATFRDQCLRPGYDYQFGAPDGTPKNQFHFRETTLALRYAWAEEPRQFLGSDAGSVQKVPVLEVAWTHGWGAYSYERWLAALYQSVFVRRLGRLTWRLEAGHVTPNVPLAKLFTLNQSGNQGANWIAAPNTFQALPDTLFLADRFANLYLAQEIGPVLWRKKRSAPYCTLLQNMAWGNLYHPEWQQNIGFRTAATPLLETGIRLDNLLQFNYLNFARFGIGTAVFYRWGGLRAESSKSNVVLRLALRMSL
jgi:hypothetical protein